MLAIIIGIIIVLTILFVVWPKKESFTDYPPHFYLPDIGRKKISCYDLEKGYIPGDTPALCWQVANEHAQHIL